MGRVGRFNVDNYERFRATRWSCDWNSGKIELHYELSGSSTPPIVFTERIEYDPLDNRNVAGEDAAETLLPLLHAICGVSYHKSAGAPVVSLKGSYTNRELELIKAVYTVGLAEYAYRNNRPSIFTTQFDPDGIASDLPPDTGDTLRSILIPCGGGKDSIVASDLFRAAGYGRWSFAINPNTIIRDVVEIGQAPALYLRRSIDSTLFELNAAGALNGHVPVTAINSLLAVIGSLIVGLDAVAMANEGSASEPTLMWEGRQVNHQWSKSLEFELLFQDALASRGLSRNRYFSVLRPLNEMQISKLFARSTEYDSKVTSCNRAYTLTKQSTQRWCHDCPKCRFVFIAMATAMSRERVEGIFGANMLDDLRQVDGYRELVGVTGNKPFECVGSMDESAAAILWLANQDDWRTSPVVASLVDDLSRRRGLESPSFGKILSNWGQSAMPDEIAEALRGTL